MEILHLVLKHKWFDMIKSGEKKQEYRDITDYWKARLVESDDLKQQFKAKDFDVVRFQRGYTKDPETIAFRCEGIHIGAGSVEWGAIQYKHYFVINLGEKVELCEMCKSDFVHKTIPFRLQHVCHLCYDVHYLEKN